MKRLTIILVAVCMVVSTFTLTTQAQTHNLSAEELADFKKEVGRKIDDFQNCLSILGSKGEPKEVKQIYKKTTVELFINEGKEYKDSNGNEHRGVHMQVSSLTRPTRNLPISIYLDHLIGLPYAKVEITQAETFNLGELKKVGDHYETVATIFQKFCGWDADGRKKYCDTTKKTIRIYLLKEVDFYGIKWIIRFGDVDVMETKE